MIGNRLHQSIVDELEKRKNSLSRSNYKLSDAIEESDTLYGFDEMAVRTTYVKLMSPFFAKEGEPLPTIEGRMLDPTMGGNMTSAFPLGSPESYNHYNSEYHFDFEDGRGYVPPPGITAIRTNYIGEGATLNTMKEAEISLKVFSRAQYNYIVPRFVRMGVPLYLEFGWTNPKLEALRVERNPREFLIYNPELHGLNAIGINYEELGVHPTEFSQAVNGNSDLLFGVVRKYDAKLTEDGGFDITINIITEGHALYASDTDRDAHSNIKLYKPPPGKPAGGEEDTEEKEKAVPFHHVQDVRNGLILLAKLKVLIQDDFGLTDIFANDFKSGGYNEKSTDKIPQSSIFYMNKEKDSVDLVNALKKHPEAEVVEVKQFTNTSPTVGYYSGNVLSSGRDHKQHDYIIVYFPNIPDLIITLTRAKDELTFTYTNLDKGKETAENKKMLGMKINYYISGRYLEDNVLSRLFGTVNNSGNLISGVRSLYADNGTTILKSNRMLTHKILIPKNFNDILVNTEAMRAVLTRTATGLHKFNEDFTAKKQFKNFSKALADVLNAHPNFIDMETQSDLGNADVRDDYPQDPNHVVARLRHMFINVDVIQEAFLGSVNKDFCSRQVFPSNAFVSRKKVEGIGADVDSVMLPAYASYNVEWLGKDEINFFFLEREKVFHPDACVDSVKEGLDNLYSTISSNFHNFPNFEVGGNPHLPGFLQVYDLRYSKPDGYYEFEVFSKDSIVKNLEFNSKVPRNVELAATFGASVSNVSDGLDSILGGRNAGVWDDLLHGLDRSINKIEVKDQTKMRGMSFNSSEYVKSTRESIGEGYVKAVQEAAAEQGQISSLQYDANPMGSVNVMLTGDESGTTMAEAIRDEASVVEGVNVAAKAFSNLKTLKLSNSDTPPPSMYGIPRNYIHRKDTPKVEQEDDTEKAVRELYPNINEGLAQMSDMINRIFSLSGATYVEEKLVKGGEMTSVNAEFGTIKNPQVSHNKLHNSTMQFTTTTAEYVGGDGTAQLLAFGTHSDYQGYIDYIIYQDEQSALSALAGTISYFELSMTIDGIAGILPGEAFTISYLPDLIGDYFYFIVKNVEQTLTETGWETTITALQRRRFNTTVSLNTMEKQMIKLKKVEQKKIEPKKDKIDPGFPPADDRIPPELDNAEPIIGTDEDQTTDIIFPPPPYPAAPTSSYDYDAEFDYELPLDKLEFETFKFDPPPPRPFLPYSFEESDTAEIIMEMTDGQVSIQGLENSPTKEFSIYPNGEPNAVPVQFSLGVTDILTDKEFWSMVNAFEVQYGPVGYDKDAIKSMLREIYEGPLTIRGGNFDFANKKFTTEERLGDSEAAMGQWDQARNFNFYVAKRTTPEGETIMELLDRMNKAQKSIGNDPKNTMKDSVGANNEYYDDIIYKILTEPERTKITVLPGKKVEPEKPPEPKLPPPPPEEPITLETAAKDPEPEPKPEKKEPPVPIKMGSAYVSGFRAPELDDGGKQPTPKQDAAKLLLNRPGDPFLFYNNGEYDNDLIYDIVNGWRTKDSAKKGEKYKAKDENKAINRWIRCYFFDSFLHPQVKEGEPRDFNVIAQNYRRLMSEDKFKAVREMDYRATRATIDGLPKIYPNALYQGEKREKIIWGGQYFNKAS